MKGIKLLNTYVKLIERRNQMSGLNRIALILLIIGGINWLLVGLFQFDLVATIFGGQDSILARIIYVIVGLCALYALKFLPLVAHDHRTGSTRH